MTTFVVLLRGVNVGGRNRLPMADLRSSLTDAGLTSVRTYIQSGNLVLADRARDPEVIAARVRSVIARDFALDVPAIALTATAFTRMADANPFGDEPDPKRVHVIALPHAPTDPQIRAVAERAAAAAAAGGRDSVAVIGSAAYLHTPDGFGTSTLAAALLSSRTSPLADGTARNWSTVSALLGLLDADA